MSIHNAVLVFSAVVLIAAGCAPGDDAPAPVAETERAQEAATPPEHIVAERGGFIPEGIEFDPVGGRLLVGSIAEGTIFEFGYDGRITPFIEDPELNASIGIRVDEARDRLLVANSDAAVFQGGGTGQARLGVYRLSTGERIAMVDLAAAVADAPADAVYFANDVAVAADGTAYVTDSFSDRVYRVGPDYQASVLHRFEPGEGGLLLNGIAHHPAGFLLVADTTSGDLFRVPVDDPAAIARVQLPEPMSGVDGIVWQAEDRLAVVSNSDNRVVLLASEDGWASARIAGIATFDLQATTAAVVDGDVYVVHPHFADQDPPSVRRVTFR